MKAEVDAKLLVEVKCSLVALWSKAKLYMELSEAVARPVRPLMDDLLVLYLAFRSTARKLLFSLSLSLFDAQSC